MMGWYLMRAIVASHWYVGSL